MQLRVISSDFIHCVHMLHAGRGGAIDNQKVIGKRLTSIMSKQMDFQKF